MTIGRIALVAILGGGTFAATAVGAQHQWNSSASTVATTDALRPHLVQPRAVLGPATGIYCPYMIDGAVGVHDLGWIPAGLNIEINVESYSRNDFDPVAAIVFATMGVPGANNVKTTTFYDNDSGGGKDARISFVAPQGGTYVLLVGDNSGKIAGCYRYQAYIR